MVQSPAGFNADSRDTCVATPLDDYELIDFGAGRKLERWGEYLVEYPDRLATGVDTEAMDCLPHMYGAANYTVIDEVRKLPLKVSDIYRRLTT